MENRLHEAQVRSGGPAGQEMTEARTLVAGRSSEEAVGKHILAAELKTFAEGLSVGCERKKGVKDDSS